MSDTLRRQQTELRAHGREHGTESGTSPSDDRATDAVRDASESPTDSLAFRAGHLVLGGVLAFTAFENLRQLDERISYADASGAPVPEVTVPAVSGLLQAGSVGVALWQFPSLAASAVATFFVSVTPIVHDFWNVDDEQERQQQRIHFLKNVSLLGAVIALLGVGRQSD